MGRANFDWNSDNHRHWPHLNHSNVFELTTKPNTKGTRIYAKIWQTKFFAYMRTRIIKRFYIALWEGENRTIFWNCDGSESRSSGVAILNFVSNEWTQVTVQMVLKHQSQTLTCSIQCSDFAYKSSMHNSLRAVLWTNFLSFNETNQ